MFARQITTKEFPDKYIADKEIYHIATQESILELLTAVLFYIPESKKLITKKIPKQCASRMHDHFLYFTCINWNIAGGEEG